jgi:hypothetical protein
MSERATPVSVPQEPHVGVFWLVPDGDQEPRLISDAVPLSAAEPYGDFLTFSRGHYEVWEGWRRLGATGLRRLGLALTILTDEYEFHPRGRIVFSVPSKSFWLYVDRRLHRPAMMARIKDRFGLASSRCVVKFDAHYRS